MPIDAPSAANTSASPTYQFNPAAPRAVARTHELIVWLLIALVGMPGGGVTVGQQLARRLDWSFVDADAVIEDAWVNPSGPSST